MVSEVGFEPTPPKRPVKMYSGQIKIINVNRLKPYFEDKDAWQPIPDDPEEFEDTTPIPNEMLQKLKNAANEKPRTRLQARLAQAQSQTQDQDLINLINPITEPIWPYLKDIAMKLFTSESASFSALTPQEQDLWNSFDRQEIFFRLTGNPLGVPEFRENLWSYNTTKKKPPVPVYYCPVHHLPQQQVIQQPAPAPGQSSPTTRPQRSRNPPDLYQSTTIPKTSSKSFKSIKKRLENYNLLSKAKAATKSASK